MDTSKLVQWLMGQETNHMAKLAPDEPYFWTAIKPMVNYDDFKTALTQIRQQPLLPLGEWFSANTKHAYCVDCGRWVAVNHSPYHNIMCGQCGYCIATYTSVDWSQPTWGADGDIAEEFMWIASKARYVHVENLGQDLPPAQDEPAYTSEGEPTNYPARNRPEWVRPTAFGMAHEVDSLPTNELALQALLVVVLCQATQSQGVFESMGTGITYAMQKAIQGLSGELHKEAE